MSASALLSRILGGAITDVPGIKVGHFTDPRRPTGCTAILAEEGAVAGVDVRGAAPGRGRPSCSIPPAWRIACMA